MPDETLETPQPQPKANRPLDETLESKQTNWPKMVLTTVLGLALLATAAYAGYWYGMRSANLKSLSASGGSKPQPKTQIPESPTPMPTPTVEDPTETWKIYKNEIYGYQFAYPPTWALIAPNTGAETTTLSSVRENLAIYPLHDFSVQSYQGAIEQGIEGSGRLWIWERGYPITGTRTIGGQSAVTWEGLMKFTDDNLYWRIHSLVLYEGTLYEFSWWDAPEKPAQQTFDQILSTFKFLD